MDVLIHEDYVNKRNEVRRRQQLRMLQVEGNPDASRPAPAPRESPRTPAACVTSPAEVVSPGSADGEAATWPPEHRLFDCLKPY
jgi:hypothetical protein